MRATPFRLIKGVMHKGSHHQAKLICLVALSSLLDLSYAATIEVDPEKWTTSAKILIADRAYDAEASILEALRIAGKEAVIPSKSNRKGSRPLDKQLYKARHLTENLFAKLKKFSAIATQYDRLARNFPSGIFLVAALAWLN